MAGRLILFKNESTQIKGTCQATGYTDLLEIHSVSFAAASSYQADSESGTAHQSTIQVSLPFGVWVAEFQQRLFHTTALGKVTITEIEQKRVAEATGAKDWLKIREIVLTDAFIESMSHSWSGIHQSVNLAIQYTDFTLQIKDNIAHFNNSEKTS